MKNNNEITIKINFSDALLTKIANVVLLSSSPAPLGMLGAQLPAIKPGTTKKSESIGFKQ